MGARPLTDRGLALLAQLPPALRDAPDVQSAMHVLSRELDYADGLVAHTRAQFNPATADIALSAWERTLKLGGEGTTGQRQQAVLSALQALLTSGEGGAWVLRVSALLGPGWSYREHDPNDATSPPANTLQITLPFAPAGARYQAVQAVLAEYTPGHLAVEFTSSGGFIWDESQWDVQEWGA